MNKDPKQEVDEELRFHLEQRTRDYIARGMSPEAAREAAARRFGDTAGVRDACASTLTAVRASEERRRFISVSWLDVKLGLRMFAKSRLKEPMARRVFPDGKDPKGRSYEDLRWSRFKHFAPAELYTVVSEHVFPFLRTLGGDDSTYAHHMRDARFTIPTPGLLAKVVDLLDNVPMEDRDTKRPARIHASTSCSLPARQSWISSLPSACDRGLGIRGRKLQTPPPSHRYGRFPAMLLDV